MPAMASVPREEGESRLGAASPEERGRARSGASEELRALREAISELRAYSPGQRDSLNAAEELENTHTAIAATDRAFQLLKRQNSRDTSSEMSSEPWASQSPRSPASPRVRVSQSPGSPARSRAANSPGPPAYAATHLSDSPARSWRLDGPSSEAGPSVDPGTNRDVGINTDPGTREDLGTTSTPGASSSDPGASSSAAAITFSGDYYGHGNDQLADWDGGGRTSSSSDVGSSVEGSDEWGSNGCPSRGKNQMRYLVRRQDLLGVLPTRSWQATRFPTLPPLLHCLSHQLICSPTHAASASTLPVPRSLTSHARPTLDIHPPIHPRSALPTAALVHPSLAPSLHPSLDPLHHAPYTTPAPLLSRT